MHLHSLKLINFKNYKDSSLVFSPKINCLVGPNGAGKTNLLDAVYYLSFTRSFFNPIDYQNIRHGEEFFALHGEYFRDGEQHHLVSCIQKKGQAKEFSLNQKRYERLADHIGLIPLVIVSPYDRDLINDGSEIRRKYIDGVISQFDHAYLDDLLTYNRALASRNALLRQFTDTGAFDAFMLDIYTPQLVNTGQRIYEKRKSFLQAFLPVFNHFYREISGNREEVNIVYQSQLNDAGMPQLLEDSLVRDRTLRYTTVGIHKDDLEFLIGGFPVKKFGSQGQQKSFVVAIKLAQFEFTRSIIGYKPILLLDDVFDKLDEERVKTLIRLAGEEQFGQVFITDTHLSRIKSIFNESSIDHAIFRVQREMEEGSALVEKVGE
ncbi:MAG: DNA replication/repair protein RecF [Bacteroidales bacterium]